MDDKFWQAKVHFLWREKLYQASGEVLKTPDSSHSGSVSKFYRGLALLLVNQTQEALDIFTPLQKDSIVNLGALLGSIYIYKHFKTGSSETLSQLEAQLRTERKKAEDLSLYYGALFLHFVDHQEKAREYVDRISGINPSSADINTEAMALKGWIETCSSKNPKSLNPQEYFDAVLAVDASSWDATTGKIQLLLQNNKMAEAVSVVNKAAVRFPHLSSEFAVTKIRTYLGAKDWDSVKEMIKDLALPVGHTLSIKVLEIHILATICHDGSFIDALPLLKKLYSMLDKHESKNAELFIQAAKLFSRVCGRHLPILDECLPLVERAVAQEDTNPTFISELAYQQLMQGRLKESLKTSKAAGKLGETSIDVMLQTIHCLVEEEQYDAAQQQLAIVEELHESSSSVAMMHYIKAALLRRDPTKTLDAVQHLKKAYTLHIKTVETMFYGTDFLIQLNPDFLLSIAEEYFYHHPEESPIIQADLLRVLTSVVDACPGLLPALYRLANVHYTMGDLKTATSTLRQIIDHVDPTYVDAYLLLAQIELKQDNQVQAAQWLEMGLSYNFQVRDHPLYHLLLARIQRLHKKDYEAALASLRNALVLSGMRPSSSGGLKRTPKAHFFSLQEKATAYIELFHVLMASDKKAEAGHVIQEALQELRGTTQEGLVLLAQVDYLLNEDDIESALNRLRSLPASHPQYLKAHEKMALIYLHRLRDEHNYLKCYKEIARQQPNVANLTNLGDAHLVLHQADLAVSAYEEALKLEPRNSKLASKIGAALVLTHQYTKALNYFKDALRDPSNSGLRTEYAGLLFRLGQMEKAEQLISESLTPLRQPLPREVDRLEQEVRLLLLLAKIQEKNGRQASNAPITTLRRAQDVITYLLKQVPYDRPDLLAEHKKTAANIAMQMAAHAVVERDTETAIRLYREALSYNSENVQCMGQLAKVYLEMGDHEPCQFMCKSLLKIDRENDLAMTMVAQIALRKNELATAALHFRQALERKPCHYEALSQFIECCQRRGSLTEAEPSLRLAEMKAIHGQNDPGLNFCRGLYEHFGGQPNAALLAFNRARGHPIWGQRAIRFMLDICLSGENEALENVTDMDSQYEVQDTELMALHTAAKLLQELRPLEDDPLQTHALYPNFYLLATRQKNNVERALQELTTLANQSTARENPGAILGMATAHLLLKQSQRAKNQLKRLVKSTWILEEGDYLERCWLFLADIYIQANKLDLANQLLRRTLTFNRSCAKAFEYLGYILEKEQSFKDAALHFESAWKLTNRSNGVVGYKLALCHLKSKQFTDAIDICQAVLTKHPDHPRIRKDVMDKALSSLRS